MTALVANRHIRVLRSVNKKSCYAPKEGVRYDGLYRITQSELLEQRFALYRFTLQRVPGQDPIRYQGPEARPNERELLERMCIRKDLAAEKLDDDYVEGDE